MVFFIVDDFIQTIVGEILAKGPMSDGSKEFSDNANRIGDRGREEEIRCKNFQKLRSSYDPRKVTIERNYIRVRACSVIIPPTRRFFHP